jgi:hypothetical protein
MSQMAVRTVNVVAEVPLLGQGEIDASPKPEPNATRTNEVAAAAVAPAKTAAQDTADLEDSTVESPPKRPARSRVVRVSTDKVSITPPSG